MAAGARLLAFRCTLCGNCCRDVRVPLTHLDLARLVLATGRTSGDLIEWLSADAVNLEGEPETLVRLGEGLRLMVLRHAGGSCALLAADERCGAYAARPLPCRTYPLVASFGRRGGLRRLRLLGGTECDFARDARVDVRELRADTRAQAAELAEYATLVQDWNRRQRRRARLGLRLATSRDFVSFVASEVRDRSAS